MRRNVEVSDYGSELTLCSFSARLLHQLMSLPAEVRQDVFLQLHVPQTSIVSCKKRGKSYPINVLTFEDNLSTVHCRGSE